MKKILFVLAISYSMAAYCQNDEIISFEDENVKAICVSHWDTNKDGELSKSEAAAVTMLSTYFANNKNIVNFNELQYFTGLESLDANAFNYCSLQSIKLPNSLTSIGHYCFKGCTVLQSIELPNSLTSLAVECFSGCTNLQSIELPNGLTSIGQNCFENCTNLQSIELPNSLTSLAVECFSGCEALEEIHIGNYVETIPSKAFYSCKNLTTVTFGSRVRVIGQGAFQLCDNLSSIEFPQSLYQIGKEAFKGTPLTSVTIPSGVRVTSESAFSCQNLTTVIFESTDPMASSNSNAFPWSICRSQTTLYVPKGCVQTYINHGWKFGQTGTFLDIQELPEVIDDSVEDEFTMNSLGMATYSSSHALDFTEVNGLKAYIISGFSPSTCELILTRVKKVPAGTGLVLSGNQATYTIPHINTDMVYSNMLKPIAKTTYFWPTDGDETNFILANGSHGLGFYTLSKPGEITAGKAYLPVMTTLLQNMPSSNMMKIAIRDEDGEATGISLNEEKAINDGYIFDLQGRRILTPQRGLYIINGKKVFIK